MTKPPNGPWFTVRDPAGPFVKAFTEAFYKPFYKLTGIRPVRATGGVEPTAWMREMVERRTYTWDVALVSMACHLDLSRPGAEYLEPLDLPLPGLPAQYRSTFFAGNDTYGNVLAYRTDAFAGRRAPQGWADFWNVRDFPGRRALRRHPMDTLEEALLADGADPAALRPYDVARALGSLSRLRPHIDTWWTGAAIQTKLLTSGQVDMAAISSIRAQRAIEMGAPVAIAWQGNIRSTEGWCILKGTPRAALCRQFVAFAATPERQAVFARHLNSSPTHPGARALIDPARFAVMPDGHQAQSVTSDAVFWSRNKDALLTRFEDWFRRSDPAQAAKAA